MKVLKCILLFAVTMLLAACGDRLELEQQAYVVVLGLDKSKDNLIKVTFQIANPQVGSTDRGAAHNEPPSDIVTFTAPDILSAKDLANSVVTRRVSFAHLQTIVISEKLAKSALFHHIMADAVRDPEMRRETNLLVSKEKAQTFIRNNHPELETRPHKYYAFMQKRWKDSGFVPYSTLNRYFQRVGNELYLAIYATTERTEKEKKDEDEYVAGQIPQKGGDSVQLMGSAVFKGGRMIGRMTGEETRYALLLRRKVLAESFITSVEDPLNREFRVAFRVLRDGNTSIRIDMRKTNPQVNVKIPLKLQIHAVPSLISYENDKQKQEILKKAIAKQMRKEAMEIVKRSQKEFKGEPFIWYTEARRYFRTLQQYHAYDWEKRFVKAKVNLTFDLDIQSFGKQLKPQKVSQK